MWNKLLIYGIIITVIFALGVRHGKYGLFGTTESVIGKSEAKAPESVIVTYKEYSDTSLIDSLNREISLLTMKLLTERNNKALQQYNKPDNKIKVVLVDSISSDISKRSYMFESKVHFTAAELGVPHSKLDISVYGSSVPDFVKPTLTVDFSQYEQYDWKDKTAWFVAGVIAVKLGYEIKKKL